MGVADDAGNQLVLLGAERAVLQQFQRGGLGGERGFEFVGEPEDVVFYVLAVVEFAAQVGDGVDEAVEIAVAKLGLGGGAVGCHGFGVAADAVDAAGEPVGKADQQNEGGGDVGLDMGALVEPCVGGEQGADTQQDEK